MSHGTTDHQSWDNEIRNGDRNGNWNPETTVLGFVSFETLKRHLER